MKKLLAVYIWAMVMLLFAYPPKLKIDKPCDWLKRCTDQNNSLDCRGVDNQDPYQCLKELKTFLKK